MTGKLIIVKKYEILCDMLSSKIISKSAAIGETDIAFFPSAEAALSGGPLRPGNCTQSGHPPSLSLSYTSPSLSSSSSAVGGVAGGGVGPRGRPPVPGRLLAILKRRSSSAQAGNIGLEMGCWLVGPAPPPPEWVWSPLWLKRRRGRRTCPFGDTPSHCLFISNNSGETDQNN